MVLVAVVLVAVELAVAGKFAAGRRARRAASRFHCASCTASHAAHYAAAVDYLTMITSLDIRNYALIDELRVEFSRGLTIITGETGAGKSIILGGLGLIMGQRADTKALFHPDEKCVVEAHFHIAPYGLHEFFDRHELDYDDELVIRREILPSGKTRAFVNDTPAKLNVLADLSRSLIDLHQQFDTLDIHEVSFQLRMLDALANNDQLLQDYRAAYRIYQADHRALAKLITEQERLRQESDFIAFQLAELAEADVQPGESAALEQELSTLERAEDIQKVLGQTGFRLVEDDRSVVSQLRDLQPALEGLRDINQQLDERIDKLESLRLELEDLGQAFANQAENTESDAARIEEINDRLSTIFRLIKKHNVLEADALLEVRADYQARAKATQRVDREIKHLQESLATQLKILEERALELRKRRQSVTADFQHRIHERLAKLSMAAARIAIEFHPLALPGPEGMDQVEYLFSANKGSRLQPIKGQASGGELSRLTLVTKSLVASAIPLPTLIFDEIDSGVSGDVALRMGEILHALSAEHQVVVITHSPQVASFADKHYFVYKEDLGDRTATRVRPLDQDARVHTIAVMLSSDPPSAPAVANAEGLLAAASR